MPIHAQLDSFITRQVHGITFDIQSESPQASLHWQGLCRPLFSLVSRGSLIQDNEHQEHGVQQDLQRKIQPVYCVLAQAGTPQVFFFLVLPLCGCGA